MIELESCYFLEYAHLVAFSTFSENAKPNIACKAKVKQAPVFPDVRLAMKVTLFFPLLPVWL